MVSCQHERFESQVNIFRLTDGDDGPVLTHAAEIEIRCAACEVPMLFMGLPAGSSPFTATVSPDLRQLRAPLRAAIR